MRRACGTRIRRPQTARTRACPGAASRIASMMPSPVMRVASRMVAISRGLLMKRIASSTGSRSLRSRPGALALIFSTNACSREGRPSQGSVAVARAHAAASPADPLPSTSGRMGV